MSNGAKITIIIAIALAIGVTIYGVTANKRENKKENNNTTSDMMDIFNEYESTYENKENQQENELNNNLANNTNISQKENIITNGTNTDVVGQEEKISANENTSTNDEQTAVELAKKEWGISVDSYDYSVEPKGEGIYEVRVIGKNDRKEVTRYTVNVKTGAVTEV